MCSNIEMTCPEEFPVPLLLTLLWICSKQNIALFHSCSTGRCFDVGRWICHTASSWVLLNSKSLFHLPSLLQLICAVTTTWRWDFGSSGDWLWSSRNITGSRSSQARSQCGSGWSRHTFCEQLWCVGGWICRYVSSWWWWRYPSKWLLFTVLAKRQCVEDCGELHLLGHQVWSLFEDC